MGKEPKKEKKLPPAPTIIRGRVSTGKRMVLDDSDDESDAVRPKVNSEDVNKKVGKNEKNETKPKKIKSDDNSPKPAKEMKKNPEEKNVVKKKNSEEKKKKTTKKELNEKGESSDVVHKV